MSKKKIFLSMPLSGKHQDYVDKTKERLIGEISNWLKENGEDIADYDIIGGFDTPEVAGAKRLYYLGEAIKKLDGVSMCVFTRDALTANGCIIESHVCQLYGIKRIYERQNTDALMSIS